MGHLTLRINLTLTMFLLLMGSIVNVRFYCNMYQKSKITMQILTFLFQNLIINSHTCTDFVLDPSTTQKCMAYPKISSGLWLIYCPALSWITITSPSFQCQLLWTLADLQPWSESSFWVARELQHGFSEETMPLAQLAMCFLSNQVSGRLR